MTPDQIARYADLVQCLDALPRPVFARLILALWPAVPTVQQHRWYQALVRHLPANDPLLLALEVYHQVWSTAHRRARASKHHPPAGQQELEARIAALEWEVACLKASQQ